MKAKVKLWSLLLIAFITVLYGNAFSQTCQGNYGTALASYQSVTAYSNGTCTGTGDGDYQCVEYVKRFYSTYIGNSITKTGNANTYYGDMPNYNFLAFAQGGTAPPAPDGILCFSGGTYGHIAIIAEVNVASGYIKIIDQNRTSSASETVKQLTLTVNDNHYSVSSFSESYSVQGWLCLPGSYDNGWHGVSHQYDPSQPILDVFKNNGGAGFFGQAVNNHPDAPEDGTAYAHPWPDLGDPSSQNVSVAQDFNKEGEHRVIALNPSRITGYYLEKGIRSHWLATTGYSTYGAPVSKAESRKYAGGALGDFGDQVTIQKFGKIGGSLKTLGYNNETPTSGDHYPAGKLTLYGDEGDKWYIDDDESGSVTTGDRLLFEIGESGSDWVWIDAGSYVLMIDPVSGPVNTVAHQVWEGNNQIVDLGGSTPPSNPQAATSVTASNVTSSSATISWSDPNNPDMAPYLVSRSDGRVFSVASSPLTDLLVLPGQIYEYTVSVNNGPQSAPSDPVEIPLESGGGSPGTLQIVSPQPGDVIPLYTYFVIDWNGVPNDDPVQVYLSRDGGDTWEDMQSWGGTASQTAPLWAEPPESDECLIKVNRVFDEDNWDVMDGYFTIGNPNDPPTAQSFPDTVVYRNALEIDLSSKASDSDGTVNWNTLWVTSSPDCDVTINQSSHTLTVTPEFLFFGPTTVKYTVQDNDGAVSNEAIISLFVKVVTSVIDNGDFQAQSLPPWDQESTDEDDAVVQYGSKPFQGQGTQYSYYLKVTVPEIDQFGFGQDSVTIWQSGIHYATDTHTFTFDANRFSLNVPVSITVFTYDTSTVVWDTTLTVTNTSSYWKHYSAGFTRSTPIVETVLKLKFGPVGNIGTFFKMDDFALGGVLAKVAAGDYSETRAQMPTVFALYQNHPNPFNPNTVFRFDLPEASYVTLAVYNILGERVATVTDKIWVAGAHSLPWNASQLSSGVYFYRIETGEKFRMTQKLMLVK